MSRKDPSWRRYLTFWRPAVDRDVDAEIRFHFDERVADLMARGRTEAEARAEAELEFGDHETYRNRMREIDHRVAARRSRAIWLDALATDVRLAARSMRRAPGLSLTVITLLALGIGANGAIFTMLDRMYLRPPSGVVAAGDLRRFWGHYEAPPPMRSFTSLAFNYPQLTDMAKAMGPSIDLAGYYVDSILVGGLEGSSRANVSDVVGPFFKLLGVRPALGRLFADEEVGVVTPHRLVVISHRMWTRDFGGDSSVIGRQIRLARQPFTIIGVASADFSGLDLNAVDLWRPANHYSAASNGTPWYQARGGGGVQVIGRLRPDADEPALALRATQGLHTSPDIFSQRTTVEFGSILAARGPDDQEREAKIAMGLAAVTLIVLLTAVANVANLLLTRAMERRREVAVRLALGVSRRRLAAQLLMESGVLGLVAGVGATVIGAWGAIVLRALLTPGVRWGENPFDIRLVLFTLAVALAAGIAAGILPLMNARSLDLASSMRGGARDAGGHRSRARASLIVAQAALSVVLLTGAILFLRSLDAVRRLDVGFDPGRVLVARVLSGERSIVAAERGTAMTGLQHRVMAMSGVRSAGLAMMAPMSGFAAEMLYFPDRDSMPKNAGGPPTFMPVSPEYFSAAGVSILRGRGFTRDDGPGAAPVVVVSETMARFVWGSKDALGQCFRIGTPTAPCARVVGVIEDVRRGSVIEEPTLQFFIPIAQSTNRTPAALVVNVDPERMSAVSQELRSMIQQMVPGSIADVASLAERLEPEYRPWRVGARLFTAFGALALIVAAIGVYSAISYSVSQRSHELGVRMALGAQRSEIGRIVVGSGVRLVGIGVVVGVAAALALGRVVESLLYGTESRDPAVLAGVAAVLLAAALVAAALPAWRATRLDPVRTLRSE